MHYTVDCLQSCIQDLGMGGYDRTDIKRFKRWQDKMNFLTKEKNCDLSYCPQMYPLSAYPHERRAVLQLLEQTLMSFESAYITEHAWFQLAMYMQQGPVNAICCHHHMHFPVHWSVTHTDIVLPTTGHHMLTSQSSVDSDIPWEQCEMLSVAWSEIIRVLMMIKMAVLDEGTINQFSLHQSGTMGTDVQS